MNIEFYSHLEMIMISSHLIYQQSMYYLNTFLELLIEINLSLLQVKIKHHNIKVIYYQTPKFLLFPLLEKLDQ